MKKLGLFSLMLLFLFSACRKDVNNVNPTTTTPDPNIISEWTQDIVNVNGSVTGFVVDENNEPMPGVAIKLANNTTTTDAFGHFFYNDITLNSAGTYLTAETDGFFKGSRRFFPKENAESFVKIQLMEKSFDQTLDAQTGGTINIGTNAITTVDFTGNSFVLPNGDTYTGTVHVAAKYLNPLEDATFEQMPGNLQGVNNLVTEVVLSTYGMIAVELEGDAGEKLNVTADNSAQMTMPVPDVLLANAPAEIPLWSFDEEVGMWVEESVATLTNGAYVGKLPHFSFWNCDAPFPLIELDFQLVGDNGTVLDNYKVQIEFNTSNAWGSVGYGISDSNGNVSGKVPANEELTIRVYSECGDVLFETNVGPFADDTSLGQLTVSTVNLSMTTFNGTLLDCNGDLLNDGIVVVSEGGIDYYHYPSSATFSYSRLTCGQAALSVKGINITDLVESDAVAATHGIVNDLGNISVCGNQLQNYLSITFDGVTAVFTDMGYESWNQGGQASTYMFNQDSLQSDFIGIGFNGDTVGDYSTDNFIEGIFSNTHGWNMQGNNPSGVAFTTFEVTEYGPNIIGTFSGEVINTDNAGNTTVGFCSGEFNLTQ